VLPSGTASQVSVTGNTRYGSGETDLSGAEVVFGNKGFGDDRTENNLNVDGQLTVNGSILPRTNPEPGSKLIAANSSWGSFARGMYAFTKSETERLGEIYYSGVSLLMIGCGIASGGGKDILVNRSSSSVIVYYFKY
jgi:hypothetical protein